MIKTQRQIRTNDDRYIVDEMDSEASIVARDIRADRADAYGKVEFSDIRLPSEPVRETREAYDISSTHAVEKFPELRSAPTEKPLYTTRETLKTELPSRPVKEEPVRDFDDVMPSLKTRSMAERRVDAATAPAERAEKAAAVQSRPFSNLSPKMKVALIVSLAVALVLAIAVIATGVSISHASAESEALVRQIEAKQTIIAEQQATIADLTSDSTLRDEAMLNGMVEAGESEYVATRAEKSDYPDAVPHTNGFDKFCDWLGGIIN